MESDLSLDTSGSDGNLLSTRPQIADPSMLYQGLLARGLSPIQASVALGNWQQESNFNTAAWNPKERALGLDQWRLDRLSSLENMARERKVSPFDPNLQMDHFMDELQTHPGGKAFLSSTDLTSANDAMKQFIAYGDDSQGTRLANARAIFAKFGGSQPNPDFAGEAPGNTNDLFPKGDVALPNAKATPSGGTDSAPAAATTPANGSGGGDDLAAQRKQMMRLLLISSLANVRLQPVDYDPYAVMPHFAG